MMMAITTQQGSSPRMRGALHGRHSRKIRPGIIPADAGSTLYKTYSLSRPEDHPRGCGEHDLRSRRDRHRQGSSPRMRGALLSVITMPDEIGIIPADAGSTRLLAISQQLDRDHPRGCGEHKVKPPDGSIRGGSSPRMRGARPCLVKSYKVAGIIPADAGSTPRSR